MTKIYIIKAFGGEYDDAWESNLFAVNDEQQAEAEVQRLKEQHQFLIGVDAALKPFVQEVYAQVRAFKREPTPPEPKGSAKAKEAWLKECEPIWKRNQAEIDSIWRRGGDVLMVKAQELGCDEEQLDALGFHIPGGVGFNMPNFRRDVDYSYEELEMR